MLQETFPTNRAAAAFSWRAGDSKEEIKRIKEELIDAWNRRVERTSRAIVHRMDVGEDWVVCTCSECGGMLTNLEFDRVPPKPVGYCPNCGAKVVEG